MYRGPAALVRLSNPVKWRIGIPLVAIAVLYLAVYLVVPAIPEKMRFSIVSAIGVAGTALVVLLLGRKFVPLRDPVALHVDQTGVYANGAPLALRPDITRAYIRLGNPSQPKPVRWVGTTPGNFGVRLPPWPLTVELITARGQFNIDPGGHEHAAAILTALGFPISTLTRDGPSPYRGDRLHPDGA